MKKLINNNFYLILFLYLFLIIPLKADEKFRFANIDIIIKKTNYGMEMLNKLNQIDKNNISKLKSFEEEIIKTENEIKLKKNIVSENELNKEINELNVKINNYKQEKDKLVKSFNEIKSKELKIFFSKINPIIQNYMKVNSINILFNSKDIIMGNKNSDLTNLLIKEINSKI